MTLECKCSELFNRPLSEREKWLIREAFYHGVITGICRYIEDPDPAGEQLRRETRDGLDALSSTPIPEDGESWKR